MQTAADSSVVLSNVGNLTQRNSSSTSIHNNPMTSGRARESVTDDEDLPQENPLQRESSSEGVSKLKFVIDFYQKMLIVYRAEAFIVPLNGTFSKCHRCLKSMKIKWILTSNPPLRLSQHPSQQLKLPTLSKCQQKTCIKTVIEILRTAIFRRTKLVPILDQ